MGCTLEMVTLMGRTPRGLGGLGQGPAIMPRGLHILPRRGPEPMQTRVAVKTPNDVRGHGPWQNYGGTFLVAQ